MEFQPNKNKKYYINGSKICGGGGGGGFQFTLFIKNTFSVKTTYQSPRNTLPYFTLPQSKGR